MRRFWTLLVVLIVVIALGIIEHHIGIRQVIHSIADAISSADGRNSARL